LGQGRSRVNNQIIFNMLQNLKIRIKSFFYTKIILPTYEEKREIISFYADKFKTKILIETGTFLGDTVEYFKNYFNKIISIELSEKLAQNATIRFKENENIKIIHGDSSLVLNDIIKTINEPILFWLDGHYSSEFQMGDTWIKTAKGEKNTPIEKELEIILTSSINHIILIDDARLFNGNEDYPKISKIKKIVNNYKTDYLVEIKNDIIVILKK
jgi:hypothetical protein